MIRWGILGMGKIATRFMQSLNKSQEGYLYAGASLTAVKREQFSLNHPHILIYPTYEDLLEDPNIDAVYIATRHNDHYQWAKAALLKKKAVLCEKPATLTYTQTEDLCQLAKSNQTFFMEAMKTRFIPLVADMKKVVASGEIGEVQRIETSFCSDVDYQEGHYLFDKEQGGVLYDVGTYNIATTLDYITSPLQKVSTQVIYKNGVDAYDVVELVFESGKTAKLEMAIDRSKEKNMINYGSQGTMTAVPFYRPEQAIITINNQQRVIEKSYIYDDFFTEIEEVHRCLKEKIIESPRMSLQDSLDCMYVMEKIRESFYD